MRNPRVYVPVALLLIALVGAAVFFAGRAEPPRPKPPETLAAETFVLKNGLSVDLVSGACGNDVSFVVHFEVGMDHDPKGRSGMTHLVRHLLGAARPAGLPQRIVETGSQHTLCSVRVSSARLGEELDSLAGLMRKFPVTELDFERARASVLAEIAKHHGGDAAQTALGYAAESARASSAQGFLGGIAEEVKLIELAEVEAFVRAHFQPKNTRVVAVGRFDPKAVRAHIETAFAPLPAGAPATLRDLAGSTVSGTLVMGDAPSALALAVAAPSPAEPLYPAFLVLAARLTDGTFPSKVSYEPLTRPEALFITAPLRPADQPDPAALRVRGDLGKRVEERFSPRDLAMAKERYARVLGLAELEPAACAKDPVGLAIVRARRAPLKLDSAAVVKALERLTQGQLDDAAARFAPARTAAVVAGGVIR